MPKQTATDATRISRPEKVRRQRAYLGQKSADFVRALLAPAAPNAALRNAYRRYRKQIEPGS
jgi:hypothetical protein